MPAFPLVQALPLLLFLLLHKEMHGCSRVDMNLVRFWHVGFIIAVDSCLPCLTFSSFSDAFASFTSLAYWHYTDRDSVKTGNSAMQRNDLVSIIDVSTCMGGLDGS
ncbi:hypothetical protein CPC08DRAFT_771729 [Agrocybe pediades]|nr:hypothetical protein CPC08DRAFT_771729 [Agrocybe pediades]